MKRIDRQTFPARALLVSAGLLFLSLGHANAQLGLAHSHLRAQPVPAPTSPVAPIRAIAVNYKKVNGPASRMFKQCVGAGRANEGLRADWQRQLTYAKQECDFQYIRMHGLLDDDMGVYSEDRAGKPIYNWQYVDELYDFLHRIHVRPFVEIGFMPGALASGSKTIFWYRGNVTPPKDYGKWHDLIKALVQHWTERYGADEVKQWYFEVWNEPNLKDGFWTGDQQEYFKLYGETAKAIKEISYAYKVGGPATAGGDWITAFIDYCATSHAPVDFVSSHAYGVKQGFLDADGSSGTVIDPDRNAIIGNMKWVRSQVIGSPLPHLPVFFTEWSSSYTPADPIHDSYFEASYVLEKIKHAETVADGMSYWTFTDIFEEAGPRTTPFHGGFGLINYQDINKAAFYSYRFLNHLGPSELSNAGDSSIVTKDARGNVQALVWDCTVTSPGKENDQVFYKRDQPAKPKGSVTLTIADLPAGRYKVSYSKVGYRANDAYATYMDIGSPSQLTPAQVALIRRRNSGAPYASEIVKIEQGREFMKTLPMRENDVYFVTLTRL